MTDNDQALKDFGAFGLGMFSEVAARAEPILQAKIRESGVGDFRDLGRDIASAMLKDSLIEAAATHFIGLEIDRFRRAVDAVFDPQWMDAFSRLRKSLDESRPAFELASGPDAAIVLSGIGVPVVPLDKKTMKPIGEPTDDWRKAAATFNRLKTAFVGYDVSKAPFYALLTDCLNSMNALVQTDGRMAQAKEAVVRTGYTFKSAPQPFQHSALLVPRDEEDRFETIILDEPRSDRGSVMFLSGWRDADGEARGITNGGYFAMPLQVAHAILHNPAFLAWVHPVDKDDVVSVH